MFGGWGAGSLRGGLAFGEVSDFADCARLSVELRVGARADDTLPPAARGMRELELVEVALHGLALAVELLAADDSDGEKTSLGRMNLLETVVSTVSFGRAEPALRSRSTSGDDCTELESWAACSSSMSVLSCKRDIWVSSGGSKSAVWKLCSESTVLLTGET